MGAVELGIFTPQNGEINLHIDVKGTNPFSIAPHYIVGLDCIVLEKLTAVENENIITTAESLKPAYYICNKTLYINSSAPVEKVIITDVLGRRMLYSTAMMIDISHLKRGMYIVSFVSKGSTITEKIQIL
jgi:hypothetical protein